jgi:CDP-6-deoxy-D-xylo-4-hexulose-3-dehydrase
VTEQVRYTLGADNLGTEETEAAIAVLRSGRLTMGRLVREFEEALARWIGIGHAVMVNSGSSANLLLVDSLLRRSHANRAMLRPGDEILVPALAWPTTVWPLLQLGLVPVYTDVEPHSLALSLDSAAQALSPRTRGLFLIHVLGQACEMGPYTDFCSRHDLVLIEDCCESFGAFDQGRHVGTFGLGGTLSHFFSHHLTTIEGGALITNDGALADDLRSLRAHGWIRDRSDRERVAREHPGLDPRFLFVMPGYNVRPMELQAAIGLVQLGKMDEQLRAHEQLAGRIFQWVSRYEPWLKMIGSERLQGVPATRQQRRHSWMNVPFLVGPEAPMTMDEVKARLETSGVDTRPIIAGNLLRHPAAALGTMRAPVATPVADAVLRRGFMIGCHPQRSAQSLETLEKALAGLA